MAERVKRFSWLVFAAVLVAVFGFGARQAVASPVYATACEAYNGGSCVDLAECEANCDAIFGVGNWIWAKCYPDGCCNCFL